MGRFGSTKKDEEKTVFWFKKADFKKSGKKSEKNVKKSVTFMGQCAPYIIVLSKWRKQLIT